MDSEYDLPISTGEIWLRRELIAAGWTDREISRAKRGGLIAQVRWGTYVDNAVWQGLDEVGRHRVRARGVLKNAHPSTVLSHQSAAAEWGVPLGSLDLEHVAVTRTDGAPGRRLSGVEHHSGGLPLDHLTVRHGVPLTTAARTAMEVLTTNTLEIGFVILAGLLHLGHTTLDEVRSLAGYVDRWPNSLNIRIALRLADDRLSSVAEALFVLLCYRQMLPLPQPQVEVRDGSGRLLGIVDFLWRDHGVFLEFDGRIKYEMFRRPGESLADYVIREKRREELICQMTGWVCIRITWADLQRPISTARRIRALLASRQPPQPRSAA